MIAAVLAVVSGVALYVSVTLLFEWILSAREGE